MNVEMLKKIVTGRLSRNVSYAEIAKAIGVTRQYVNQIKEKNLTNEQVVKLEQYFGCDIQTENDPDEDCWEIPIKGEVVASMGYGVSNFNEKTTASYSISKKLIADLGINKNNTEMIFARGDSMMPTIEGGDSLLVDRSKIEIYDGRIYCVRIQGQIYAKRLQKIPPNTIRVVSDNPKYRGFEVDLSSPLEYDFQVIGEVKWWGRVAK